MADGAEFDRKGSDSARALAVQRERFSADDFSAETTQSFDLSSFHEAQQNGKDGSPHAPGHGNGSRPSQSELNLIGKDPIQRERFSTDDFRAETTQSFDRSSFHEAQQNGKDDSPHAPGQGNGSRLWQPELST